MILSSQGSFLVVFAKERSGYSTLAPASAKDPENQVSLRGVMGLSLNRQVVGRVLPDDWNQATPETVITMFTADCQVEVEKSALRLLEPVESSA